MNIKSTIVYLPVEFPKIAVTFYKNIFSNTPEIFLEDGLIIVELPKLNLYLIDKNVFEEYYSQKAGRNIKTLKDSTTIISCVLSSEEEVNTALAKVSKFGGTVTSKAATNEALGIYAGYFSDPDGHIWELAYYLPGFVKLNITNLINVN